MREIIIILFTPFIIFFINYFFLKNRLIPNYSGNNHQKFFNNKNIPLTGGILLCMVFSLILTTEQNILKFFILLIFLVGFFSDINFLSSVKYRFFFQLIIITFFIYFTQSNIQSIRIDFLDKLLQNFWISSLFTTICFLILINGTNFIDGLNGLVISYFLIILFIIYRLETINLFIFRNLDIVILIISLITLLCLNFSNYLYLGDSGSYLIGFLLGYLLILTYKSISNVSPYFIALLLWYPAFEILFTIIRKLNFKKSPFKPDNNHFHHQLFFFIDKKFKFNKIASNNISSVLIITYNLIIFNISLININFSVFHISLIFFNIGVYLVIYFWLTKFRNNNY